MSRNVRLQLVVCIAIFAILFLGSFQIGPVSIRNIVALLLGVSIVFNSSYYKPNRIFNLFVAFVIAVLFCTMVSGELLTDQCLKFLIGYHFTSLIVFIALYCLLSRMDSIEPIILFISAVFLLNAVVTIAQSFNYNSAWQFVSYLYPESNIAGAREKLSDAESVQNVFVCGALCGSVIGNGYFTSVFFPLATLSMWKNNAWGKVYALCIMAITLYASFCLQQRMCFYSVVFYSLFMIFFSANGKNRMWMLIFFVVALMFIGDINPDHANLGHLTQSISADSTRHELFRQFRQFLHSGNILVGGQTDYLTYGSGQHNTFLDCMTRYGLIGTSFMTVLYFSVLGYCVKSFFKFRRLGMYEMTALSVCPVVYLLYSLTHSTGLQSGDPLFWIVFVLLCAGESKYNTKDLYT